MDRIDDLNRDTVEQQFVECLKFLAITSSTSGRRIAVIPEVDRVWHELILQTMSYEHLCSELPGKQFLHHESISPSGYYERVGDREFVREFIQWIPDYVQNFGPFTARSAALWTVANFLETEMGMSLSEINRFGRDEEAEVLLPQDSPWLLLGTQTRISPLLDAAAAD
ncbi:hypothetical protein [Microbacterium oxydans]|uniref:hypothetical protein n=2 Tax=Microbacteriaceae TaxID=85023 RepID=UPI00142D5EAE|nr:hypothetical protein [Microbacterium oxydans]